MIPNQIHFVDFSESEAVRQAIEKRIEKFGHFYDRITHCDVTVSCPHRHRHSDRLFEVHVRIALPGDDVIVNRPSQDESHRDIYVAIRDAFNAADRALQDKVRIMRHETKDHQDKSFVM